MRSTEQLRVLPEGTPGTLTGMVASSPGRTVSDEKGSETCPEAAVASEEMTGAAEDDGLLVRNRRKARRRRARALRAHPHSVRFLRYLAVAEATAFLILLATAVYHGVTGGGSLALFIMGNVHGGVFTSYLVSVFIWRGRVGWGPVMLLLVVLAGFVPGGGLMVERWALHPPENL